ncbi:hypothetical protein KF840_06955 [bacterium]|nr:hypothetical protein [bacterium]
MFGVRGASLALCAALVMVIAHDQRARAAEAETRLQRLEKEFSDPLTTLPQLFLQDAYTPVSYGTEAPANRVVARAIIPRIPRLPLLPFVQLVRPSLFLVTAPTGRGGATRTGLGDLQLFDVAVLPWPDPSLGLRLALGPLFIFPTATNRYAGQGAWQVGPTFGAIYKGVPWLLAGCLLQNPVSFAYTSPDRAALNTLLFQPILLVSVGGGWYAKSADATWTMGWRRGDATVLPLSAGIGRVFLSEDTPPINVFVSGEWTAYRQFAPLAPQTTVRVGVTVAFPDFRPWD